MISSPRLRQWTGPLTDELVLEPARFGLGQVPRHLNPDQTTDLVCGFCSTGCALTAHLKNGEAINLTPALNYPVNLGMACPKGWEALTPLKAPDRATAPLLRNKRGQLEPTTWEEALRAFCDSFKSIQKRHGPASVAYLSTGQMVTEEMTFLGALAKFGMGMIHGDGNTRQCMATTAAAYKESFGFDAPPFTYADFEQSDVIVLIGANLCIAHPILWRRVLANRRNPQIIVIDPRQTETALAATTHYALQPKSDLALLYGLARLIIERGAVDAEFVAEHTLGFTAFATFVQEFSLERVTAETGLSDEEIRSLAAAIASGKRVSFWWTMGVNQSHQGTRTAQAIINLALLTGNIGKPGTGANSITGQCNAMGSRIFSNNTNLFGGRRFEDAAHREQVARLLELPVDRIPTESSWAYDQIIEGIRSGEIRGLWIVATNTLHSWIDQQDVRQLFKKLEFVVVQDMYSTTETAAAAHLVLPAAGWGEKEGTFINSERRIGVVKKIAKAPGQALADFQIFRLIAHYWGCADLFKRWSSPEAVFRSIKQLSAGRPCDITGIDDYQMLAEAGGVQWPLPAGASLASNERRLFEDGRFFHSDGKARFIFEPPQPPPEFPDAEYPFLLLTGRASSAQWHTQTRTGKSAILRQLYRASVYFEINAADARAAGIAAEEIVEVISRRGRIKAAAVLTPGIAKGQLFIPMHYPQTNRLTFRAFDPVSRQPAYKCAAVRLEKIDAT